MFARKCPKCGKEVCHTSKGVCNNAIKKGTICMNCENLRRRGAYLGSANPFYGRKHKPSSLHKMKTKDMSYTQTAKFRKKRKETSKTGKDNPMYGKSVYEFWLTKHGKEKADELLNETKKKWSIASSGVNSPMYGKPAPQGSGCGWKGWYKNWFFRSLRELSYMINVIEKQKLHWRSAETKELGISYIGWQGEARTYFADFLVEERYLVEVKPEKLKSCRIVRLKQDAAVAFCNKNGLQYQLIDPPLLSDKEVKLLYKKGRIKFTDRYEKMFLERYNE